MTTRDNANDWCIEAWGQLQLPISPLSIALPSKLKHAQQMSCARSCRAKIGDDCLSRAARHNTLLWANVLSWGTKIKLVKHNICNKVREWQIKRQHKICAYNPVQRDNIKGCYAALNTDCHLGPFFFLMNPPVYNCWIDLQQKLCAKMNTWCFKGR